MIQNYVIKDGTAFTKGTSSKVIDILSRFMHKDIRLKLSYGDKVTGRDWDERHDITGYIGRSTGQYKIPLLLNNKTSSGGGGILTENIVRIEYANKKLGGLLYKHPKYHKQG